MLNINKEIIFTELAEEIAKAVNPTQIVEIRNVFVKKYVQPLNDQLKTASPEDKKEIGSTVNVLKTQIFNLTEEKIKVLKEELENKEHNVDSDITINSTNLAKGALNPITLVVNEIASYFRKMDFEILSGSEITTVKYNFDNLNAPKIHPTRDASETFYIDDIKTILEKAEARILRTQTTAATSQYLENNKDEDIRIATYGYVYRNDDDDMTHSHQFNQFEFVWVAKDLNVRNLKWIINGLVKHLFGEDMQTRFRLSNFPFTEPSFEVDYSCPFCGGKGCNACKHTGWIEILGCGVLHKNVLDAAGIQNKVGLAMGLGVERVAMFKYGINDVRDFYSNNFTAMKGYKK